MLLEGISAYREGCVMPLQKFSDWFILVLFLGTAVAFIVAGNQSQAEGHTSEVRASVPGEG